MYPRAWKVSTVTPIHKDDYRSIVRNYHPVSLLSIPSKKLERCIFNALYPYVAPYLRSNQYGIKCKRSTSLQLFAYLDGIYRGSEVSENSVCSLYLDFSKAFDKINHHLLLQKLKILGVTGQLLGLLKSYLIDRQQYVTIGSCSSSEFPVEYRKDPLLVLYFFLVTAST